jgi:basic membrane lipoprotein Med (substrate-binding protein (PBP1-ABC) superfamily)
MKGFGFLWRTIPLHLRLRPARAAAVALAIVVLACGCNSADDWSRARAAAPTPVGTLGPGFVNPSAPPSPEATITPSPGSWNDVRPSKGYRVVLLTAGDDPQTQTLVTAVRDWAEDEHVSLKTVKATAADQYVGRITEAIDLKPDLIVSAGNALVDPLALVTASHLDQQFLLIGAEVAEPTANVTAADWPGASYRGEGLGMSSTYDPKSFTPARATAAIRSGVASVLHGLTGIVIWLT